MGCCGSCFSVLKILFCSIALFISFFLALLWSEVEFEHALNLVRGMHFKFSSQESIFDKAFDMELFWDQPPSKNPGDEWIFGPSIHDADDVELDATTSDSDVLTVLDYVSKRLNVRYPDASYSDSNKVDASYSDSDELDASYSDSDEPDVTYSDSGEQDATPEISEDWDCWVMVTFSKYCNLRDENREYVDCSGEAREYSFHAEKEFHAPFEVEIVDAKSDEDLKWKAVQYDCTRSGGVGRVVDARGKFVHAKTEDGMLTCANNEFSLKYTCSREPLRAEEQSSSTTSPTSSPSSSPLAEEQQEEEETHSSLTRSHSSPPRQAVAISNGRFHTCTVLDDGAVSCWGGNDDGQVGDGTNHGRNHTTNGSISTTSPTSIPSSSSTNGSSSWDLGHFTPSPIESDDLNLNDLQDLVDRNEEAASLTRMDDDVVCPETSSICSNSDKKMGAGGEVFWSQWCVEDCDEVSQLQDIDVPQCEYYLLLLVLAFSLFQFFKQWRQFEMKQNPLAYCRMESQNISRPVQNLLLEKRSELNEAQRDTDWEIVQERKMNDQDDFVFVN